MEEKAEYRIASPRDKVKRPSNNPDGRPKELKGGKYIKIYADTETIKLIEALVKNGRAKNQSEAVRNAIKKF